MDTNNVEVIDIDSSSEEEKEDEEQAEAGEENNKNSKQSEFIIEQTEEKKPEVALTTLKIPGPAQILEARRKKIDELLEYYGDTHNRLLSLLPFMNPEQKTQWHKMLNLKLKQVLPEVTFEEPRPPPQQEQPSNSVSSLFNFEDRTLAPARVRRAGPVRRYKVKRKKRPRQRSSPKKSTYTARKTTTTIKSSNYTPRVNVKSEHKPSRSSGFGVTVKKER